MARRHLRAPRQRTAAKARRSRSASSRQNHSVCGLTQTRWSPPAPHEPSAKKARRSDGPASSSRDGVVASTPRVPGGELEHALEPDRPLEPPVAEQLGVERRADDAAAHAVEPGDQAHEVLGLLVRPFAGVVRPVDELVADVGGLAGDPPEAQPGGPMTLVEVEEGAVARIAALARPDLRRRACVAQERRHRAAADPVRLRVRPAGLDDLLGRQIREVGEGGVALAQQVAVDDRPVQPLLGEELLVAGRLSSDAPVTGCCQGPPGR
jgi:hypothetical protein